MFSRLAVFAVGATLFAVIPLTSAFADDCTDVFNAMRAGIQKPYAAAITTRHGTGRLRTGNIVMIDDKMYIQIQDIWRASPAPRAQKLAELDQGLKTSKVTCQRGADESVDGQPSTVYTIHNEKEGNLSDDKVWVSKALSLPIKSEDKTTDEDGVDTVSTSTMNYSDVHAPNGAK